MRAISLAEANKIIDGTFSSRPGSAKPMRWLRSCSMPADG
jgi:hypothetical protein